MWTIVIEAGGKSTRMGMDKALMPFNGEPLIQRIIRRLDGGDEMMIVAKPAGTVPDAWAQGLYRTRYREVERLSGVHTALACASHPFVIITACDLPFVNAHLICEAMRHLVEEMDVVIPRTEQGLEPFHAVYRRKTVSQLPSLQSGMGISGSSPGFTTCGYWNACGKFQAPGSARNYIPLMSIHQRNGGWRRNWLHRGNKPGRIETGGTGTHDNHSG